MKTKSVCLVAAAAAASLLALEAAQAFPQPRFPTRLDPLRAAPTPAATAAPQPEVAATPPPAAEPEAPRAAPLGAIQAAELPVLAQTAPAQPAAAEPARDAAAPPPTAPAASDLTHVVGSGDTFYAIGRRYGVGPRAVAELNGLNFSSTLRVGQRIRLPAGAVDRGPEAAFPGVRRPAAAAPAVAELAPPVQAAPAVTALAPQPAAAQPAAAQPAAAQPTVAQPAPASPPEPEPEAPAATASEPEPTPAPPAAAPEQAPPLTAPPVVMAPPVTPPPPAAPAPATPLARPVTPPFQAAPTRPAPTRLAPRPAPPAPSVPAPAPTTSSAAAATFRWPVRGSLLAPFGPSGVGQRNDGIRIGAPEGTSVRAAAPGRVVYAGDQVKGGYGKLVLVEHEGRWFTAYAHLGEIKVRMQDRVVQDQELGSVGRTGSVVAPQLYFEVRHAPSAGDRARPVDPLPLLPK